MPRKRQGEILAQKVFMCPMSLLQALKEEAKKERVSEPEIIRRALREKLRPREYRATNVVPVAASHISRTS
ncbi:ribbon-helix-helix protein, CopG family [Candidatus Bipolaricaulota bacterium]|nr:ribbon-helix-helix protein, CopG family [Candidatus Bipolaricaulota bacterium]